MCKLHTVYMHIHLRIEELYDLRRTFQENMQYSFNIGLKVPSKDWLNLAHLIHED